MNIILIEITVGILLFATGYALGRLRKLENAMKDTKDSDRKTVTERTAQNKKSSMSYNDKTDRKPKLVSIDETKFVTKVKTEDFKKDFDALGETVTSEDDISQSISKLSKLKNKD